MSNDYRVRITKKLLQDALAKLMCQKKIEKITVRELCELAGVNRSTFYLHYLDIYDLLEDVENSFYDTIYELVRKQTRVEEGRLESDESVLHILVANYCVLIENRELVRALFGEYGDPAFKERILLVDREQSLNRWRRLDPNIPDKDLEELYLFFTHGGFAIVQAWVTDGMKDDVEYISRLIYMLRDKFDNYVVKTWKQAAH